MSRVHLTNRNSFFPWAYSIMLKLYPDNAHDHWKQVEGSYCSRQTPQENWDGHPNAPAAVESIPESDSRNMRFNSIIPLPPTDAN